MVKDKAPMKTIEKMFEIIDEIQQNNGIRLVTLSEALEMPPSSVHRYLETLQSTGYVIKKKNEYFLSLKFLDHGIHVRNQQMGYPLIEEKTKEIAEESGERVQFTVYENGEGVHLWHAIGEQAVETDSRAGKRVPLHATSAGKCILAALPDDERESILADIQLTQLTPHTITDKAEFREEIDTVNERGYAITNDERIDGLRSIGVPIVGKDGVIIGSMTISGPSGRMRDDRLHNELSQLLLENADDIKLRLRYS